MKRLLIHNFLEEGKAYHYFRHSLSEGKLAGMHGHNFHEVFWVESGEGVHQIHGEKRPLSPGMLNLIRATDCHNVVTTGNQSLGIVNIAFRMSEWRYVRRKYFAGEPDAFALPLHCRELLRPSPFLRLGDWADLLSAPARPAKWLHSFLIHVASEILAHQAMQSQLSIPDWLQHACDEIAHQENFSGGTARFCRLAGRSPSHTIRECRKWLKKTPTEIVNAARMNFAANELAYGNRTISDIAFDCGLANISHFYKLFRFQFNVSPRQFRLRAMRPLLGR